MTTKFHKLTLIAFLVLLLALVGCEQQAPIIVYVTPTPVAQIGAPATAVGGVVTTPIPTVGSSPTEAVTPEPTVEVEAVVTDEEPEVTEAAPETAVPRETFIGPIIGPEYTLPPTETPRPTATPTEGPSPTPTEGPTEEPTATSALPAGTPLPGLDPSQMGIQLDPNLSQEDWQDAVGRRIEEHLGVDWVKVQVAWEDLQPNGPQDYSDAFNRMEQNLQYADREGLNILVSIAKAPAWARSNQAEDGPPDNPQALADFITFLLTRLPIIDAVEIWNEPNLQREWQGVLPFTGAGYMQLFRPAYQAVRAISPNITVVAAGLAPTGNNPGSRDDRQYLREMYANGLAQYADVALGIHPYGWGNPPDATCCGTRGWDDDPHFFFLDTIRAYREIMVANGHNTQLWVTEFGWATWDGFSSAPPEQWMTFNDRWDQANYTIRAFEIGQQTDYIGPMFLWNLNFAVLGDLVERSDERAAYSLVVPLNPAERPLYWMIYDAVRPDVQLERYD